VPQYVVLSRLTAQGRRTVEERTALRAGLAAEVEAVEGKLIAQYALLGAYDFCTIVELPNNTAAHFIGAAHVGARGVERTVLPAIDLPLFARLVGQTTETTGPHRWQIRWPVRLLRRVIHRFVYARPARRYFQPFVLEGREQLRGLRGPAIFIGNHASHLDSAAIAAAIPWRYRAHTYWGSAADRWFLKGRTQWWKQGWWRSLAYASFPIQRGGGSGTLAYAEWLIDRGASIGIFPEGTRTTTGSLGRFKPGTAILALRKLVPVVPIYMDGLHRLLPKGSQDARPGPVRVRIGAPIRFAPGTEVAEATRTLQHAMQALREECRALRPGAERPVKPAAA
jgi:1-acyl-sn-glycerol-3-phosphate acyltransferase